MTFWKQKPRAKSIAFKGDIVTYDNEEKLGAVRAYLTQAFPEWELAEQWDFDREAQSFRLSRHRQPIHLLKITRQVLDDNHATVITALLNQYNVKNVLRSTDNHRLMLTTWGLVNI